MCNRYVWLFTLIFWAVVFTFDGWRGIGIILAFSIVCLLVFVLIERRSHD